MSHPAAPPRALALALAASTLLLAACRSQPAPAPAPVSPDTWATVDGRELTREHVEREFRRVSDPSAPLSEEELLVAKLRVLEDLIVEDILIARGAQLKIELTEDDVAAALTEVRGDMPPEAFDKELARRTLTVDEMRQGIRRELLARKVIEREVSSKVTISDDEVSTFFEANRAQFNLPEEAFRIAQIVVTPVRDAQIRNRTGSDASSPQEAAAKASMLMERLRSGARFEDLAMDYSEDPDSAPRGGDLGLVPLSAVKAAPAPLRDAVLQMNVGSARAVAQGGVHTIAYVAAREPAGQRDLSTPGVRERITEGLKAQREQLLRTAYLTSIRSDARVVNHLARRVVEQQGAVAAKESAATPPPGSK